MELPLQRYRSEIEAELKSLIDDSSSLLRPLLAYHLGWIDEHGRPGSGPGGKMLRPVLCLLACEAVGGDWRQSIPAAAAVELAHNFSLIHDDIEDWSLERRGRPAVWQIWGQAQAINAGDAMHIISRLALLRLEERGISAEKVLQAARLLDQACLRLCQGQYLDICYQKRLDIDTDDYLRMISEKTAALFECALKLGALLGGDDEGAMERLGRFGHNLGLAFQVQDDILGIWGQEQITGKSSTSDIQTKKKTLPVVYGLKKQGELLTIYQKEELSPDDEAHVVLLLDGVGARDYAQGLARSYLERAWDELGSAPVSPGINDELKAIAASVTAREH